MSTSETITRTDLTNILNEVLPSSAHLKTATITGTTNAQGAISLSSIVSVGTDEVVSVKTSSDPNYMCVPWIYNNATWYVKVINWDSFAKIANTSVSLTIKYFSKTDFPLADGVSDYIVEKGTSGIWTYRKWNSGIAECWGAHSWTITSWSQWGNVYESNGSHAEYPSGLFVARPTVNMDFVGMSGSSGTYALSLETGGYGSKDQSPNWLVTRPSAGGTNITAEVDVFAKGKWK